MKKHFLIFLLVLWAMPAFAADSPSTLPGTTLWAFPPDIVTEQYAELRGFYERQIAEAAGRRSRYWNVDTSSVEAFRKSIASNVEEFRRMIGAVDTYRPPKPVLTKIGEAGPYSTFLVQWPLMGLGTTNATEGYAGTLVSEYGILLVPTGPDLLPAVIAVADATDSAADIAGLTDRLAPSAQFARQLALSGYVVFAPFFIGRRPFSEPWTDDRDWLLRVGFQVGHHLIGSEVQQVSSAVDFLSTLPQVDKARIGMVGSGQGGLTGLYTMALETRLKVVVVSGYFGPRDRAYEEPEDRTLWKHLVRFGDAEIAFMAAPRVLIVESGGNPEARPEFEKVRALYGRLGAGSATFWAASPEAAWERLDAVLKPTPALGATAATMYLESDRVAQIANAQFTEWQAFYKNLAMEAYTVRDAAWRADFGSIAEYRDRWLSWAPKSQ